MAEERWMFGKDLSPEDQAYAKQVYIHRFTGNHKPTWATYPMPNGEKYRPLFRDDEDWLANTEFPVTKRGRLVRRLGTFCRNHPTWPFGKPGDKPGPENLNPSSP